MQFFNKISLSFASLIFISNLNVFAYPTTAFISANSTGSINIKDTKIISSNKNGEVISNLSENSSLFQLSFSQDENSKVEQYAKIINPKNSDVFVYSSPSNSSSNLGKISVGSIVLVTKVNENFSKILFNDNIGYIETKYIETKGVLEKISNEPTTEPEKMFANITSKSGAILRQAPSENSKILKTLPFNINVQILEIENNWLKISNNGEIGFIKKDSTNISNNQQNTVENTVQNSNIDKTNLTGEDIVNFAKNYIGKPYIYGSTDLEKGTDCSGFTYSVFKHFGINLNRISRDQYLNGTSVEKENLMAGDLVFFNTGKAITHVGIYIGNNEYIHSTDTNNKGITISNLDNSFASKYYYGAKRVI